MQMCYKQQFSEAVELYNPYLYFSSILLLRFFQIELPISENLLSIYLKPDT